MKYQELIERYIYAVTKNMPGKSRADVAKELESIISDMLDARCEGRTPTEADVRIVLAELGTPEELFEKYNPNAGRYLIGPEYYGKYEMVLKIVGACLLGGLTIALFINVILNRETLPSAVLTWFTSLLGGALTGFAIVTIIFAVFERRHVVLDDLGAGNSIDNLPPVPKTEFTIPVGETVASIVSSIFFTTLILVFPSILAIYFTNGASPVPIFDVEALRSAWWIICALAVLSIAKDCMQLVDGRYTMRLLAVSLVTDVLSVALMILWLLPNRLLSAEFLVFLDGIFTGSASFLTFLFANCARLILAAFIFGTVVDIITRMVKTIKAKSVEG